MRALVVDDSEFSRIIARRCLEDIGLEVSEAEDGLQGLKAATATRFDVIVADLNMPFVDGIDMFTRLRSLPGYEDAPFVVITAESSSNAIATANELGIRVWMAKPIQPMMLAKAVTQLLPHLHAETR
ncbi:MAG: response regulator [Myxococcales bacterium]|nr:response regulator [Myxococcales bacterium]MDD9966165.1 response regulator [Myxococcales bacterium]